MPPLLTKSSACSALPVETPTPDDVKPLHRQLKPSMPARPRAEGPAVEASAPGAEGLRSLRQCLQRLAAGSMSTAGAAKRVTDRGPSAAAAGALLHAADERGRLRQRRPPERSGLVNEAEACTVVKLYRVLRKRR